MEREILIIDADVTTCYSIKSGFKKERTEVHCAFTAADGIGCFAKQSYALVIMDINFEDIDGFTLLDTILRIKQVPVLVISECIATSIKVAVLKRGADDFLAKPFEMEECMARVEAILRRYVQMDSNSTEEIIYGCLRIHVRQRMVFLNGVHIKLTRREFDLLIHMVSNPGIVFTYEQLYERFWRDQFVDGRNSVGCQIRRLRRKLGNAEYIESVWDVGYRFNIKQRKEET